jgi:hypothetical protein
MYQESFIKTACFKACTEGFSVKTYLDARAKASIEKIQLKKEIKVPAYIPASGTVHASLLQEIKAWRAAKADEKDLPVYMVLPQKTLYELVEKLPVNLRQLKDINGFGKKKVLKYGDELLAMICSYLQTDKPLITAAELAVDEPARKPKPEKGKTQRTSLEMFRQGKTILEIAKERAYALTTIEGHLSTFIETGELDVLELVSAEKLEYISAYYKKAGPVSLSEAITALENTASYGELRMVRSHFIYLRSQEQIIAEV